jgi:hypothetical protein
VTHLFVRKETLSNLIPPVRELQGCEKWNFKRRYCNKVINAIYPLLKSLSLPVQRCFIKYGHSVRLTEAVTSEFIAKNTTIPVPRVLDVFKYNGTVHIVQEFIDAPLLYIVWRRLGPEDRKRCMLQLKGYIEQLRSLVPPEPGKVQSIDGEGFTDNRVGPEKWGPFESHAEFNKFFLHDKVRSRAERYPRAQAPLAVTKGRTWRTVFAHGDLGPHNILWDMKRGEIAAVIDWEFAGWFPEYWDYTRAYFGPAVYRNNYGWWEMFQEYTQCYQEELDVEIVLSDYFTLNL